MLFVAISWLVIWFICTGAGMAAVHSLTTNSKPADSFIYFFAGVASITFCAAVTSLFVPITWFFLFGMIVVALLGWLANRSLAHQWLEQTLRSFKDPKSLYILPVVLIVLLTAIREPGLYDTYSYHAGAINWIRSFKVIKGLANLHGRFGFNSHFLITEAVFDLGILVQRNIYLLNGLFFILTALYIIQCTSGRKLPILFSLYMASFLLDYRHFINSASPDVATYAVCFFLVVHIYRNHATHLTVHWLAYILIGSYLFTVRISCFPILVVMPTALLLQKNYISFLKAGMCIMLLCAPFFVRNYYLSGYLVYPVYQIDLFSCPWKEPLATCDTTSMQFITGAKLSNEWIKSWAILPDTPVEKVLQMSVYQWVPVWFSNLYTYSKLLVLSCLFALGILVLNAVRWITQIRLAKISTKHLMLCALATGVVFNFITAPDLRFSLAFYVLLPLATLHTFSVRFKPPLLGYVTFKNVTSHLVCITACIILLRNTLLDTGVPVIVADIILPEPIKHQDFIPHNLGNVTIYEAGSTGTCGATIPCTPYFSSSLQLLGSTLEQGFKRLPLDSCNKP